MTNSIPKSVKLEEITCPNGCSSSDKTILKGSDNLHDLAGEFQIVECNTCKLQRTSPRPTPDTIGYYYPQNYGPYNESIFKENKSRGFKALIRNILGLNYRVLPSIEIGQMLEIGCSTGSYMELAKSKGWHVEGIEFSNESARIARDKGFKVHIGSVETAPTPKNRYDIIVAWMVMEHFHEPHLVLNKIKEWINPDGYFVFLVPNANSISRKLFKQFAYDIELPRHLFHYTPESLNLLLKNCGWQIENIVHQKNAFTFLKSIEVWSRKKKKIRLNKFIIWFNNSSKTRQIRTLLHFIFGLTKQSGRIEVWAKPTKSI